MTSAAPLDEKRACRSKRNADPSVLCYVNSRREAEADLVVEKRACRSKRDADPSVLCYVNAKREIESAQIETRGIPYDAEKFERGIPYEAEKFARE